MTAEPKIDVAGGYVGRGFRRVVTAAGAVLVGYATLTVALGDGVRERLIGLIVAAAFAAFFGFGVVNDRLLQQRGRLFVSDDTVGVGSPLRDARGVPATDVASANVGFLFCELRGNDGVRIFKFFRHNWHADTQVAFLHALGRPVTGRWLRARLRADPES